MIFIHYAKNYARDFYCMYNCTAVYMTETVDITGLLCIFYGKPEAREKVIVDCKYLPFELKDAEAKEGVTLNAAEPKVESKND